MKDGEEGSDRSDEESEFSGGWMERPFMFLSRLGAGDVLGLSSFGSETDNETMPVNPAKGVGAKLGRCVRLMGESGDDEGEGSERSDESVQDTVVVGEESADSFVVWVDVLSLCLWTDSDGKAPGLAADRESAGNFASSITSLGSIIVTGFDWSMSVIPVSTS